MDINPHHVRAFEKPSRPTEAVIKWWSRLAPPDRPIQLAKLYPRVLNKIVASWHDAAQCERILSELVIDTERYDRLGFPFEVMMELLALGDLRRRPGTINALHRDGEFTYASANSP